MSLLSAERLQVFNPISDLYDSTANAEVNKYYNVTDARSFDESVGKPYAFTNNPSFPVIERTDIDGTVSSVLKG